MWNENYLLVIGIILAVALLVALYFIFRTKAKEEKEDNSNFEQFLGNLSNRFYEANRFYIKEYNGPQMENDVIASLIAKYVANALGNGPLKDMPNQFNELKKAPWTDKKTFGTGDTNTDSFIVSMLPNLILFYRCHSKNGFTEKICYDFLSMSITNKVKEMLPPQNPQT